MLRTPLLFLVFNRPALTEQVLAAIRDVRPAQLFVAADGPREGHAGDFEKCQATRDLLRDKIDWECEVRTLLRERNLGCKAAVNSAITWFFGQVEEGIILEDDCLPVPGFFTFCQALLERYAAEPSVMHISGDNFQRGQTRGDASYYRSRYAHIWGWATWRRAWQQYDATMSSLPEFKASDRLVSVCPSEEERAYWLRIFERTSSGEIDTWDYQWQFALWAHNGAALLPNRNLVKNIGFGSIGTHSKGRDWTPSAADFSGPLVHPAALIPQPEADAFTFDRVFSRRSKRSWWQRFSAANLLHRRRKTTASLMNFAALF